MNRKLVLAAVLVFGVAGLILAQGTVKAQDTNATDNSVASSDNSAVTSDNAAVNADSAEAPADAAAPADTTAPVANAAQ